MGPDAFDQARTRPLRAAPVVMAALSLAALAACDGRAPPASPPAAPAAEAPALPPDVSPPSAPQDLEAAASAGAATLAWTRSGDDRGVEGYEVFRGEDRVASTPGREHRDAGLRTGERYCYTVVAFDGAGNRSERSAEACVVPPDAIAPAAPADLAAALSSPVSARLRWSPSSDDMGVDLYEILLGDRVALTTREPEARLAGLAPGRELCWTVRAVDAAGNRSEPAGPACVSTPDLTPPSAPSLPSATASQGRIELRWEPARDDVGVVAYEVLRDGAVVAKVSRAEAADLRLSPAVQYCYQIRAVDAAGHRSPASAPICGTPPDVTPPASPQGVTARAEGETVIALAWTASTDDVGVARYEVLHGDAAVARATGTAAKVTGLRPAVEYCHAVRACDAAGNCSTPSQPSCATTPDLTPPGAVANVSPTPDSDTRITVRWSPAKDNVGVTAYQVRRDGATNLVAQGGATSATDEGLEPARRYCYVVVAEDAAGNVSPPSKPACATTPDLVPPTQPPRLAALPRSGSKVALEWERSTDDVGVAGYDVLRDGEVVPADTDGLQANVEGLSPETEFCFAVLAFDRAGNRSKPTAPVCVTTARADAPVAPWNLKAYSTPSKELLLVWDGTPAPGLVYVVYWDGRRGVERRAGTTPTTRFTVFGQAASERHCWRVSARDERTQLESARTFPVCDATQARSSVASEASPGAGGGP